MAAFGREISFAGLFLLFIYTCVDFVGAEGTY